MSGLAALPMYDWPEVRPALDGFWQRVRDGLRRREVAAPAALDRTVGLMAGWLDPRLVLGQTCGLPFVRELAGRVALVGAGDWGLPGCAPGCYRSAVLVRADDPRPELAAFRGARLAINGTDSQSGWGSILHQAAPLARDGRFFGAVRTTGAHARSVAAVARGEADLAAVDAVSWRLAQRFVPEAAALRVLALTDPTPGLPWIAAAGTDPGPVAAALAEAGAVPELGLRGYAPMAAEAYGLIARRLAAAAARLPGDVALAG